MAALEGPETDLEKEEFARLYDTVRRALHVNRAGLAAGAAEELLAKYPGSTTAHELMGDVLVAQGKRAAAKAEYRTAMDLEPANADAERKWAEVMLTIGQADRTRQMLESGQFAELRGAPQKDPGGAAMRSMFFPGLGQLYNGEYEKGLATVLVSLPLFGCLVSGIANFIGTLAVVKDRLPVTMSTLQVTLAVVGLFGYGILWVWSTYDAYRMASGGKEEPPELRLRG